MIKQLNFRIEEERYFILKEIALKERRTIQELLNRNIEEYLKLHAKTPQYSLDEFEVEDYERSPQFMDQPIKFEEWFKTMTPEDFQRIKSQVLMIERKMLTWVPQ